jgi:hypothetical protein
VRWRRRRQNQECRLQSLAQADYPHLLREIIGPHAS